MKISQTEKLYTLLKDGRWHSTREILHIVYGSEHFGTARCGARINDLKNGKWSGRAHLRIEGKHDPHNPTIYWYRIVRIEQSTISPDTLFPLPTLKPRFSGYDK